MSDELVNGEIIKTKSRNLDFCFFNKTHKRNYKPDSVNSPKRKCLLFICALHCCKALAVYPSVFGASNSYFHCWKNPIYLTLHRKEFTWFHYKLIYILSVALVLILRPTDVIRFAALWCPDFPTLENSRINKPFFLWRAKIMNFQVFPLSIIWTEICLVKTF